MIQLKTISIYLLLYNSSITDIEHSPNYTAFGLPQTHQVRLWQPYTVVIYIYIYNNTVLLEFLIQCNNSKQ